MNVTAWAQDLGLLFGGLWKGFVDLAGWLGALSSADVLSCVLLAEIAFLIFSDIIGAERCRRWGGVLLYIAFIYTTLSLVPDIWKQLYIYTNGRINLVGGVVVTAAGMVLVPYLVFGRRERRWWVYAALAPVGGLYALCVIHLHTSPAERLHLAEYGLLSWLTFRALSVDMGYRAAYLWGWVVASGLGGLDEAIQGCLPNRVGEWSDVGLNVVSCGLGIIVVMLVAKRGDLTPDPSPTGRGKDAF